MQAEGAKPLSGRTWLADADVHRMTLPSFWWTPQGTPRLFLREASNIALLAFAGLGLKTQLRLRDADFRSDQRRMKVRKYGDEWWIPMTWTSHRLVDDYRNERPGTVHDALFVTDDGALLDLDTIWKPFFRADGLLGNAVPLTTMLAGFFADRVKAYGDAEVVRAFVGRKWPGEIRPEATMAQMAAMLDDCDPMGRDVRHFDEAAYAADRTKALGGTPLPLCLWDISKSRGLRHRDEGRLPDDHPSATVRAPVSDGLMPDIDRLGRTGGTATEQAGDLLGVEPGSFRRKRSQWKAGGKAGSRTGHAAKLNSRGHARPAITRKQERTRKALRKAVWPRPAGKQASFRQDLVDRYFSTVAGMILERNMTGSEAAGLFRVKPAVISDLRAELEAGLDPVTRSTTDPKERLRARRAVEKALEDRGDATLADIARRVRRDTGIRISSEFVRAIHRMSGDKARSATAPRPEAVPARSAPACPRPQSARRAPSSR